MPQKTEDPSKPAAVVPEPSFDAMANCAYPSAVLYHRFSLITSILESVNATTVRKSVKCFPVKDSSLFDCIHPKLRVAKSIQNLWEVEVADYMDRLPREGYVLYLNEAIKKKAKEYSVVSDIHFEDFVFNATYEYYKKDFDYACEHYYLNGRTSAERVAALSDRHLGKHREEVRSVLDFASGYGCVSRHLPNFFQNAEIVPMDIHEKAYWFNRVNVGLEGIVSSPSPEGSEMSREFDIVFALSFFSHMPERIFTPWIRKLASWVRPGGLLIFTTHGETSHRTQMPQIPVDERGFGFIFESEQFDLPTSDYGHAVSYAPFVHDQLSTVDDLDLMETIPGIWWTHQDAFVLRKSL